MDCDSMVLCVSYLLFEMKSVFLHVIGVLRYEKVSSWVCGIIFECKGNELNRTTLTNKQRQINEHEGT